MKKFLESYNKVVDTLSEAIKKTTTRNKQGKITTQYKSTRPGYRIKKVNGRPVEVRMSPIERRHRSDAAKKSAKKRANKFYVKKTKSGIKKK